MIENRCGEVIWQIDKRRGVLKNLFEDLKCPSSRYLFRYSSWFNVYNTASPIREERSTESSMECSHSNKASTTYGVPESYFAR